MQENFKPESEEDVSENSAAENEEEETGGRFDDLLDDVVATALKENDMEFQEVTEAMEDFHKKEFAEKEKEVDFFTQKYRSELGFAEGEAGEEAYTKKRDELLGLYAEFEQSKELLDRQKEFIAFYDQGQRLDDPEHPIDKESYNAFLAAMAKQVRIYAEIKKTEYLLAELKKDKEFIETKHIEEVLGIAVLEKTASDMEQGVGDGDEQDPNKRYVCRLPQSLAPYAKRFANTEHSLASGQVFSILALLIYVLDEKRMDAFMENWTKKKVWKKFRHPGLK